MNVTIPLSLLSSAKTKEDRTKLSNQLLAARPLFNILREHLLKQLETLDYVENDPHNFAQPEVTHRLAYQAGQRKALNSQLDLLEWVITKEG